MFHRVLDDFFHVIGVHTDTEGIYTEVVVRKNVGKYIVGDVVKLRINYTERKINIGGLYSCVLCVG